MRTGVQRILAPLMSEYYCLDKNKDLQYNACDIISDFLLAFPGGGNSGNRVRRSPKTLSPGIDYSSYWPTIASLDFSTVQMTSGSFLDSEVTLHVPLQRSVPSKALFHHSFAA